MGAWLGALTRRRPAHGSFPCGVLLGVEVVESASGTFLRKTPLLGFYPPYMKGSTVGGGASVLPEHSSKPAREKLQMISLQDLA